MNERSAMNQQEKPASLTGLVQVQEGTIVSRTLVDRPSGTVTLFAFGQGQGLSEHTAPFDALAFVLEGFAEISINGLVHTVHAGEILRLPAGVPHALKAPVAFKMLLVMIRS